MLYTIQKNIPLPKGRRGFPSKYPFREMEVGDCFLVPIEEARKVSNSAYALNSQGVGVFRVRSQKHCAGIWRVA